MSARIVIVAAALLVAAGLTVATGPARSAGDHAPAKKDAHAKKDGHGADKKDAEKKKDGEKKDAQPAQLPALKKPVYDMGEPRRYDPEHPLPYEMMRELRQVQDRIAAGDAEGILALRTSLEKIGAAFEKAEDEVWKDPRNARAVLAFTLNGGDPRVLRGLLLRGQPEGVDTNFARGVHAHVTGRQGEVLRFFVSIDPLQLEPTLAAQVALAQAEIIARTDLNKALERLDLVRLLAPGTLLEEAALRRQVTILSTQKNFPRADQVLEVYFRRFGRSAYSGALKRQIVRFAVERPAVDEHAPLDVFETAVGHLPQRDQLDIYAELAKEAVAKSRRDLVTLASGRVQALGEAAPNYRSRATLYMAALNVASLDVVKARNDLAGIPREHLSADEIELMGAAKAISEQIDRVLTVIPTDRPEAEWTQELSQTFANVARSRTLIEGADKLLSEASK